MRKENLGKETGKTFFLNYKIMKLLYMPSIPMKPGHMYTLLSFS